MSRPIWKGNVTFGLVNVPVALFPAERNKDLQFRLLDSRDKARIRYERINEDTGEEVPWDKVVRGYEYNGGNYVLLTDKDFERVAVKANQTIEIEHFVPREAMMAWIKKKAKLGPKALPKVDKQEAPAKGGKVINMLDMLQRSVAERTRTKSRGKGVSSRSTAKGHSAKRAAGRRHAPGKGATKRRAGNAAGRRRTAG